jgi:hypothetical protein
MRVLVALSVVSLVFVIRTAVLVEALHTEQLEDILGEASAAEPQCPVCTEPAAESAPSLAND